MRFMEGLESLREDLPPSLRGANGSRFGGPDDRLRDEAIHLVFARSRMSDHARGGRRRLTALRRGERATRGYNRLAASRRGFARACGPGASSISILSALTTERARPTLPPTAPKRHLQRGI